MTSATQVEKDPVLEYINKNLLNFETEAEESVSKAVNSALSILEDELREAGICREVDSVVEYCEDSTCRASMQCDDKVYEVELALSVKATISYVEKEEGGDE